MRTAIGGGGGTIGIPRLGVPLEAIGFGPSTDREGRRRLSEPKSVQLCEDGFRPEFAGEKAANERRVSSCIYISPKPELGWRKRSRAFLGSRYAIVGRTFCIRRPPMRRFAIGPKEEPEEEVFPSSRLEACRQTREGACLCQMPGPRSFRCACMSTTARNPEGTGRRNSPQRPRFITLLERSQIRGRMEVGRRGR